MSRISTGLNIVWMGTILDGTFWIAKIQVGIFWVGIFQVGVILGGNCLSGSHPGWELPGLELSWVEICSGGGFSGGNFLGGSFSSTKRCLYKIWSKHYKRFVDSICVVFEKPEDLLQFASYITKQHSNVIFFAEAENNCGLVNLFLPVLFCLSTSLVYHTDLSV